LHSNLQFFSVGNKVKLNEDSLADDELDRYPFLVNMPVEFKLRDEPAILGIGVN
jgi:hypothetical protein